MSYDLSFSRAETLVPEVTQIGFADLVADWSANLPDPLALTTNQRIEGALFTLDRGFVMYSAYFEELPGRMFEFGHESGIGIKLVPWRARLRLPYWYRDKAEARTAFRLFRKCAKAIESAAHYTIYDPQLKKTVTLTKDADAMLKAYLSSLQAQGDCLEFPWDDKPASGEL